MIFKMWLFFLISNLNNERDRLVIKYFLLVTSVINSPLWFGRWQNFGNRHWLSDTLSFSQARFSYSSTLSDSQLFSDFSEGQLYPVPNLSDRRIHSNLLYEWYTLYIYIYIYINLFWNLHNRFTWIFKDGRCAV